MKLLRVNRKLLATCLFYIAAIVSILAIQKMIFQAPSITHNNPLPIPAGVRLCSAFGTELKAGVSGIPVPFFTLDNVLEIEQIGHHLYNF